nr:hypothetical protein [Tanacetum cinerariifolium]
MGLPSILDEGTRKSKPLPKDTITHPKDSRGNVHPLDRDLTFTTFDEATAKSTLRPEGSRVGEEMDDNPQSTKTQHQSSPPRKDKPTSSTASYTEAFDTNSSSDKILKKYDDTLPLTEQNLVKYLRKVSRVLFERITEDQWENIKRQLFTM